MEPQANPVKTEAQVNQEDQVCLAEMLRIVHVHREVEQQYNQTPHPPTTSSMFHLLIYDALFQNAKDIRVQTFRAPTPGGYRKVARRVARQPSGDSRRKI
ncbi:unnamed protein product [Nippostrongylus brasiliensis]|uniref:Uncharacterized protein n=1 Tax=Nippostrongylus brasiliensis TaxID=27835 RepID=A0A0N4YNH3_NIPBR|nr:unnamed protein product [Nippostrongylus brasiliensis]